LKDFLEHINRLSPVFEITGRRNLQVDIINSNTKLEDRRKAEEALVPIIYRMKDEVIKVRVWEESPSDWSIDRSMSSVYDISLKEWNNKIAWDSAFGSG
jgi:hypothetical protein